MKLKWTTVAKRDLQCVFEFIAEDSPEAASKTISKIYGSVLMLKKFPDVGRPGRCKDTRELIIPGLPYIAAYRLKGSEVHIVSIIHTSMKWPDILPA